MPEMDGYEATATIRRREGDGRRTPIIAMTAGASTDDEARCIAAGMDAYVSKPVKPQRLSVVLERLIGESDAPDSSTNSANGPLDAESLGFLKELEERDPQGTAEMVGLFLRDARSRIDSLNVANEARDSKAIVRIAHSLRGSSASLSASTMAALCADLSEVSDNQAAAAAAIARINGEFERVATALSESFKVAS